MTLLTLLILMFLVRPQPAPAEVRAVEMAPVERPQTSPAPRPAAVPAARAVSPQPPLKVCMLCGSDEYDPATSFKILRDYLQKNYHAEVTLLVRKDKTDLPGLEALDHTDVVVLFMRRMELKGEQLDRFRKYCLSGRPLVALRTSSHAVQTWLALDKEVLGGSYVGHYGEGPKQEVVVTEAGKNHPILQGFEPFASQGSLYRNPAIAKDCQVLLRGKIPGHEEPIAWTRVYKGARIFYTSLGHPGDFAHEPFLKMLSNAIFWTANREATPNQTTKETGK